jgi:Glycosyltransferase family 10 (fucosyltransferase) C-term
MKDSRSIASTSLACSAWDMRSSLHIFICWLLSSHDLFGGRGRKAASASRAVVRSSDDGIAVQVYHLIDYDHGSQFLGNIQCPGPSKLQCTWYSNQSVDAIAQYQQTQAAETKTVVLTLYNVHTLWARTRAHYPLPCKLPSHLTMIESQESRGGYGAHLFSPTFKYFDGISTVTPSTQQRDHTRVQRIYDEAYLDESTFLPLVPFSQLIKGAAFLSSHCLRLDKQNSRRDDYVVKLRKLGLRVDGLGACLSSGVIPEGIKAPYTGNTPLDLEVKRKAINRYMFNFAFENQIEPGYVTEKVFDALIAGTVPIYLGDATHCKSLLPRPDAAIFLADFDHDVAKLMTYLQTLMTDPERYEQHRSGWRKGYNLQTHAVSNLHLNVSWHCRVCQFAATSVVQYNMKSKSKCVEGKDVVSASTDEDEQEEKGSSKGKHALARHQHQQHHHAQQPQKDVPQQKRKSKFTTHLLPPDRPKQQSGEGKHIGVLS